MSKLSLPELAAVTLFGFGYSPIAPATVASAVTCVIFWFIPWALTWPWALLLIPVTAISIWLSGRAVGAFDIITDSPFMKLRRSNPHKEDPDQVVIDEFVGQWITLLAAPHNLFGFTAAFIVFRILDIAKPLGIEQTQKAPGGWGIVLDDVFAGIGGAILLLLASRAATWLLG
jgi:phosphatidylglycerophosphatase A